MTFRSLAIALGFVGWSCSGSAAVTVHDGDIVFQTSRSTQSQAIQAATHSPYSHMGLVLIRDGEPFVFEAVGRVQFTPLMEWVHRGEGGRYVVKRLRGERPYDPYFEWSDERVYCQVVKSKLAERYGHNVPSDERVISPSAIFASPLLEAVR